MQDDTRLARWLSGEMEPEEREALENSPEFPTLSRIKDNFEKLKRPEFDQLTILENVLRHEKTPVKIIPFYKKAWIRVAAMIVVLLGIGIVFFMPKYQIANNNETLAFTLPDDSEVILNAGSQAKYATWDWSDNREVDLTGEAYFKVAKGKKFSVKTELGTVTVLGTKFNVRSRLGKFDVICYEGKVRVTFGSTEMVLLPGQGISISNDDAQMLPISASEPEWLKGELVFTQESFDGVIAEIERKYDVKIKTTVASSQEFSGSLPGTDLDTALKIISLTYHLHVEKDANIIILTPADARP
ncbi:MAG: DUF4974 domain-containing protein [Flavobacterium sp.]|uniref:FecR family protein n=1 Tax=Flavobacterium sp. TaxID=239 RepID=UPI0012172CAB|nr:FecR domain-containing protein [Flavobacterium sp.]RZJ67834.1 MAG: DUF4974 domain-containing protein [Flavobacterium sp.]